MLHGVIYATHAVHLDSMSDADFGDQVREFFGTGTQLQEMYITRRARGFRRDTARSRDRNENGAGRKSAAVPKGRT